MNRRLFLETGLSALAASSAWPRLHAATPAPSTARAYRAAVIGRTGGGDYGHGYDTIFRDLPNVTLEAVADADPDGLEKARQKTGARRAYRDYRAMLDREKPDLVSIAPRQPDCHREMALAAIEAGAHIFIEKPLTATVADADAIVAAARRRGTRIAVAHTRRFSPPFVQLRSLLREDFAGVVREVHIRGKQDQRAGGEDLIVLGTHDFDLMRFLFGDPAWCFARVQCQGRDATRADVRTGHEPIRVLGDTIHAMIGWPDGLVVTWSSKKTSDHWNTPFDRREKWSFEILGTRRIIGYQSDFAYLDSPFFTNRDDGIRWRPLPAPQQADTPLHQRHPIRDLIHAIETGGQPLCNAVDGAWAIEIVSAIYQSHLEKSRVALPLQNRAFEL